MVIYADQVILGSIVMDYVILWSVSKLVDVKTSKWRLACAAIFGGLYSIAVFVPAFSSLLIIWIKIIVSIIIIFIAFFPLPAARMCFCLFFFYLVSFALGGSVIGMMYFFNEGGCLNSLSEAFPSLLDKYFGYALLVSLIIFWAGSRGTAALFKKRYSLHSFKIKLTIKVRDKNITIKGFLDSGNQLKEPVTGNPAIIVQYNAIKDILPGKLVNCMENNKYNNYDAIKLMEIVKDTTSEDRFTLIPFRSIGEDSGMLLGFRPDEVKLSQNNKVKSLARITVALYHKEMSPDNAYCALVHPDLMYSLAS